MCICRLFIYVAGCSILSVLCSGNPESESMNEMQQQIADLAAGMDAIIGQLDSLQNEYRKTLATIEESVDMFKVEITNMVQQQRLLNNKPGTQAILSIFGCVLDVITISCPSGKTIAINDAHFGQYLDRSCPSACCGPHPTDDCVESLQVDAPVYWDSLIQTCNYQTSCNVEVPSHGLISCSSPQETEYMEIIYTCNPQTIDQGIGFTATAISTAQYTTGNVVKFSRVLTNVGGHFNSATSVFICPVAGTYVFTTTLRTYSASSSNYYASIMHDGSIITSTVFSTAQYDQGFASAVVICNGGDRVWVESHSANYIDASSSYQYSTFSGFLLSKYV